MSRSLRAIPNRQLLESQRHGTELRQRGECSFGTDKAFEVDERALVSVC
jgi:hypothetical protein